MFSALTETTNQFHTKQPSSVCWFAFAAFLASFALATAIPEEDAINHLLKYVEISQCTFIRNGVDYDSKSAVNHIKQKYNYFKSEIYTADDFITLAATKSELTGRPYFVRCGQDKAIPSADWLRNELDTYRKSHQK
jgi:hypothetical protein